jgi:predicted nucleic acid-binding protein
VNRVIARRRRRQSNLGLTVTDHGSLVDCMVAASAMAADAALATSKRKDFQRLVPLGLRLV